GGAAELGGWGPIVMAAGVAAAVFGVVIGTLQRNPRHVLAYSSMSQFGLMTVGVGAGLSSAEAWPVAVSALVIYMTHHGFAKASLFLTVDASDAGVDRRAVRVGALVAGFALAGLPLTSGAIAKVALKGVTAMAPSPWASVLETALPIAAVGTTILVARFAFLVWRQPGAVNDTIAAANSLRTTKTVTRVRLSVLVASIAFVVGLLWLISYEPVSYAAHKSLTQAYVWTLSWPVLTGVVLAAGVWHFRPAGVLTFVGIVPPGDVWARPLAALDEALLARGGETPAEVKQPKLDTVGTRLRVFAQVERRLLTWPVASAGAALLALVVLALTA
ncbi:MAG: proton-conducting transporter membrane subunit, partial [Actinomycetota bacterium]|nr:proton-conducting transporter membrane subunit [Actinomycetota bacterium]